MGLGLIFLMLATGRGYYWWKERAALAEDQRIERAAPEYGPWQQQLTADVIQTMGNAGFSGHWAKCGVTKQKQDLVHRGRYLVRCSDTGQEWSEYRVDIVKDSVAGPYTPSIENNQ